MHFCTTWHLFNHCFACTTLFYGVLCSGIFMLFGYLACNNFDCTAKLLFLPAATAVRSKRDPELFLFYMHSQACFYAGQLMPLSRDRGLHIGPCRGCASFYSTGVYLLDPVEGVPTLEQPKGCQAEALLAVPVRFTQRCQGRGRKLVHQ